MHALAGNGLACGEFFSGILFSLNRSVPIFTIACCTLMVPSYSLIDNRYFRFGSPLTIIM